MPPRQNRPMSSLRGCLVPVAAGALTLVLTSQAFTAAPLRSGATRFQEGGVSAKGIAQDRPDLRSTASTGSWHTAGCAVFLLAVGLQAVYTRTVQTSKVANRKAARVVTTCHAAVSPALLWPSVPDVQTVVPSTPPVEAQPRHIHAATVPPQLATLGAIPCLTYEEVSAPSMKPIDFVAGFAAPCAAAAKRSARRHGCARRAGASRCKSARRASAGAAQMSASASRRHVGAKLVPRNALETVAAPSFDASKVRTKIQLGLRNKAITRSASARETKTPASGVAVSNGTRMNQDYWFRIIQKSDST